MGLNPNSRAIVIDLACDAIVAYAKSYSRPVSSRRGMGRPSKMLALTVDAVRVIRASTDKIMAIAAEFGINESLVCAVRSRTRYAWVD